MPQDSEFENWEQINHRFQRAPELPFSSLLPREKVEGILSELNIPFRDRVYSPTVTL